MLALLVSALSSIYACRGTFLVQVCSPLAKEGAVPPLARCSDKDVLIHAVPEERYDAGMVCAGGASAHWRASSHHRPVQHARCAVC